MAQEENVARLHTNKCNCQGHLSCDDIEPMEVKWLSNSVHLEFVLLVCSNDTVACAESTYLETKGSEYVGTKSSL